MNDFKCSIRNNIQKQCEIEKSTNTSTSGSYWNLMATIYSKTKISLQEEIIMEENKNNVNNWKDHYRWSVWNKKSTNLSLVTMFVFKFEAGQINGSERLASGAKCGVEDELTLFKTFLK